MKKFTIYAVAGAALLVLLTACGGGGGGAAPAAPAPVADATDKYVGAWGQCAPVVGATNGVLSARSEFVFSKLSATGLLLSVNGSGYKTTNCTGAVFNTTPGVAKGSVTLNGTKTIGADTVDKMDIVLTSASVATLNGSFKDIALATFTTLKFGATTAAADAQGYPSAIDNASVFTRF